MSISPARKIAFDVLLRVEQKAAFASDLLHGVLERTLAGKSPRARKDAALATELALGVLRWQRQLDFLIEKQTGKSPAGLDAEVRIALRLGLYQLRYLSRIPVSAAVNESVELVKAAKKRSAAGLVNAVLRRAPRGEVQKLLPRGIPLAELLGIVHSHPTWLVERWLARFGETNTVALLNANNRAPETTVVVHEFTKREELVREWHAAGASVERGRWLGTALRVRGVNVASNKAFARGEFSIQDEASQLVAHLLDVHPGDSVLDVCAAPGGKTVLLAMAAGPTGTIVAGDRHVHRLRTLRSTLQRTRMNNVLLLALNGEQPLPFRGQFQRILVDAPCSGTGTLARNPEIRWRLQPEDLQDLHQRQVVLLTNALECLAPGGRLVYSTCSLEPEENEHVVSEALRVRGAMRRIPASIVCTKEQNMSQRAQRDTGDAEKSSLIDHAGFFRTFPPEHGTDGFFAAVFERRA